MTVFSEKQAVEVLELKVDLNNIDTLKIPVLIRNYFIPAASSRILVDIYLLDSVLAEVNSQKLKQHISHRDLSL